MSTSSIFLVRQFCKAQFRALTANRPAIVLVRQGLKKVQLSGGAVQIHKDMLGVLPANVPLTIENVPHDGRYIASVLLLGDALLRELASEKTQSGNPLQTTGHDRAASAFHRAATVLEDPLMPETLKEHAVREVLLWLAEEGIGFGAMCEQGFAEKLRSILSAEPDTQWRALDAARSMAVSEPTLRRRLAASGTSFADLLADVRMTHALGLLQTTQFPINRIALDVGYASPSRFALRFRNRFGIPPSAIRKSHRTEERSAADNERKGAGYERIGTVTRS